MARPRPKRLFKDPSRISSYRDDRTKSPSMKAMARDHADVLQNVEFALVQGHRADPSVDDRDAREALRAHLAGKVPEGPRAAALAEMLASTRELRPDVADDVWNGAVRVVDESIGRHSGFQPGESSYLRFVAKYIK